MVQINGMGIHGKSKMEISRYSPNLNDTRVIKSITRALEFSTSKLNRMEFPLHISARRNLFGNSTSNHLSAWLEANLLIDQCAGYVVGQRSKLYKINQLGHDKLLQLMSDKIPPSFYTDMVRERYKLEIQGEKPFEYTDKKYRLWHPLQFERREIKDLIFPPCEGWVNYDISAAMPSLFLQLHHQLMNSRGFTNSQVISALEDLPYVERYIKDKVELRSEFSQLLDIDLDLTKKIINGLFNRGRLVPHRSCSIFRDLNGDEIKLYLLERHEFIRGLRIDMRKFWARTYVMYNKKMQSEKNKKVERNLFYFSFERLVLNSVIEFLSQRGRVIWFLEHDGFRSKGRVEINELQLHVENKTGFKLDWQ